ncbi:MAG: hypothetical protein M3N19_10765 [Candidatus Eremiobacteraeota bacterium]|nr:hypothetical protein [Candidatus Eremiobacteraeota bacterium]
MVASLCRALHGQAIQFGLTSIGRDGEAIDAADGLAKPRLFLQPQTMLATARDVLPRSPASELLDTSMLASAAGPIVYVSVRNAGFYEVAGPPTASGIRNCIERLFELGAEFVVLDGAVDRVAALAGMEHAVIVSTGASNVSTPAEAIDDVRALVARLSVPKADPNLPILAIEGALTAPEIAALIAAGESRQIVVRDPTQIAVRGKAFLGIADRLNLRCLRPLRVIAVTVASIGRDRYFEPRAFLHDVAHATGLPAFDIYAGAMAAA